MTADFDPRRGKKGATYAYTTGDGATRELQADDEGIVTPKDAAGVAALDTLGLSVARSVTREEAETPRKNETPKTGGKE